MEANESVKCALNPHGVCVSMSEYNTATNSYDEPLDLYFPSAAYTYCEPNDANCSACKERWSMSSEPDSPYCVGADGCICVAACESSKWPLDVVDRYCNMYSMYGWSSQSTTITIAVCVTIGVAALFFGIAFIVKRFTQSLDNYPFNSPRSKSERRQPALQQVV